MKSLVRVTCLLLLCGTSYAADELPIFTGYFAGVTAAIPVTGVNLSANHAGFASISGVCDSSGSFVSFSPGAYLGGVFALGARLRFGLEGTYSYNTPQTANIKCQCSTTPAVADRFVFSNTMQGTFRSRIGYTFFDNLLPYLLVGGNIAALGLSYSNEIGDNFSTSVVQMGVLLGAGVEWKMANAWSLRGQYHFALNSNANLRINTIYGVTDPSGAASASSYANSLELGLSYWF